MDMTATDVCPIVYTQESEKVFSRIRFIPHLAKAAPVWYTFLANK